MVPIDLHLECNAATELASNCPLESTSGWMTNASLVAQDRLTHQLYRRTLCVMRPRRTSSIGLADRIALVVRAGIQCVRAAIVSL